MKRQSLTGDIGSAIALVVAVVATIAALALKSEGADPWAAVRPSPWSAIATVEEPKWTRLVSPTTFPADAYRDVHSLPCGQFFDDVHEQTHLIQHWLDNSWGLWAKRQQAVYCLRGRVAVLSQPPLTLRQVADAVPQAKRGRLYQTYLINQQQDRNDRPLAVIHEWVCYANDATWQPENGSREYAWEYVDYAETLLTLAERCDGYDAGPLRTFVRWHAKRVADQQIKSAGKPADSVGQSLATPAEPSSCPGGNCGQPTGRLFSRWRN